MKRITDTKRLCLCAGFTLYELQQHTRKARIVFARYLVMCELMKSGWSESDAAGLFFLNHSTANHAKTVLKDVISTNTPAWGETMANTFKLKFDQQKAFEIECEKLARELMETKIVDNDFLPFVY